MGIPERAFTHYARVNDDLTDKDIVEDYVNTYGDLYPIISQVLTSFQNKAPDLLDLVFIKFADKEESRLKIVFYDTNGWGECLFLGLVDLGTQGQLQIVDAYCERVMASYRERLNTLTSGDKHEKEKPTFEENTFEKDEVNNNTFISTSEDPRSELVKAYINKFPELESVVLKILEVFKHVGLVNHNPLEFSISALKEGQVKLYFRHYLGWSSSIGLRLNDSHLLSNLTASLQGLIMAYSKGFADKAGFHMNPFTTPFNHQFTQPTGFAPNNGFGGYRSTTETPRGINEEYRILNNPVVQNIIRKEVTKGVNSQLTIIQQQIASLQQQIEFMKFNRY